MRMRLAGALLLGSVTMACGVARAQKAVKLEKEPVAASKIAPPANPATVEQIAKMMAITHSLERMRDGMHTMIQQQKASVPYLPEGFWIDLEAEMGKVDWVAVATPVYQRYLSQEDAAKAIAFYSTDAGQRSLDSSMAVVLEMNAKGFEIGKAAGERIGEKYKAEIEENIRKMQAQQAGTAKQ